jgi:ferredoxin-NADP reductase
MILNKLTLSKITKLTHDVHELIFVSGNDFDFIPGQFLTFILPSWLRRAYSIAYKYWNKLYFIVKRLEDWKWWSRELCDLSIWDEISYVWPVWNFIINSQDSNKLFLWTWTWFAPLFCQIKKSLENWCTSKMKLIFWVRYKNDLFYELELKNLKNEYTNFDYLLYLSREDTFQFRKWYVSGFLTRESVAQFEEFYVCGRSQMIQDSKCRLENLWIQKERIFFEQY